MGSRCVGRIKDRVERIRGKIKIEKEKMEKQEIEMRVDGKKRTYVRNKKNICPKSKRGFKIFLQKSL